MASPPAAPPASPPASARPTRLVVLAVGHILFTLVTAIWTAVLSAGLIFVTAAGKSGGGAAAVAVVAALNAISLPLLISGAIALMRCTRWGFFATVAIGLLGMAQAMVLLLTGASYLLVTALLIYPVTALVLITAPTARRACGVR